MTSSLPARAAISHIILDIEGTTCPFAFVKETLFPYAADQLEGFLAAEASNPQVEQLLRAVEHAWEHEDNHEALELLANARFAANASTAQRLLPYLKWLIRCDKKLTPLKDLQGLIWERGYEAGHLCAPLFEDVPPALQRWERMGIQLGVYSSGSIKAQQLLYAHSIAGNLQPLFTSWFDTRIGTKQDASSYTAIAFQLKAKPKDILFISDVIAELHAASAAGMHPLLSDRPGNPSREAGTYPVARSFAAVYS
ncbi:acireductone synthase [Synechococcus sp. ATX 2A4]|uniref:acireductone synthase n=1 Tax=Synechococcus sp. ATX 2A4 TaxID=2823727 RepID=UPI0020CBF95E|nr:acireductone synthase [Synechococcus sp. ATX 2A4]MCP9885033.1 acireductone synthase [Synechococcus sp. ATX 2A4]